MRLNHKKCDAPGLLQFLNAIAEMARGAHAPSILPVWERELLFARYPSRITCAHHEYEDVIDHSDGSYASSNQSNMLQRSFYFGAKEMRVLRKQIPPHLISTCSTFDLITACLWKCRTLALKINTNRLFAFHALSMHVESTTMYVFPWDTMAMHLHFQLQFQR